LGMYDESGRKHQTTWTEMSPAYLASLCLVAGAKFHEAAAYVGAHMRPSKDLDVCVNLTWVKHSQKHPSPPQVSLMQVQGLATDSALYIGEEICMLPAISLAVCVPVCINRRLGG